MENDEQMFDDPEPLVEDDPAVKLEMFEIHKYRGLKPDDLRGATSEYRASYAAWLEANNG
jgi:hypothetical protein